MTTNELGAQRAGAAPTQRSLSAALRERTAALHVQAERSGIVNNVLRGKATRHGYALFLRNLLPAYEAMERGLESHREEPIVGLFARPDVYRTETLHSDLAALHGDHWESALPLLPAGRTYAERVADAACHDGARLIAHAYARYLGDLSGGQVMKTLLRRSLGLTSEALSFYDFPRIADRGAFKTVFRRSLDCAGKELADFDAVVEEGAVAFALNIDVSTSVLAAAG